MSGHLGAPYLSRGCISYKSHKNTMLELILLMVCLTHDACCQNCINKSLFLSFCLCYHECHILAIGVVLERMIYDKK